MYVYLYRYVTNPLLWIYGVVMVIKFRVKPTTVICLRKVWHFGKVDPEAVAYETFSHREVIMCNVWLKSSL